MLYTVSLIGEIGQWSMQDILEFGDSGLNLVIELVMKEKPLVLTTFL